MNKCPDDCKCYCHFDQFGRPFDNAKWTPEDHKAEDERMEAVREAAKKADKAKEENSAAYWAEIHRQLFKW